MANETHSDGNTELQEQIAQNEAKMDELQQKLAKESELSSSLREQLAEISAEFTEARLKFDVQLAEAKEMDSERLRQIETYRVEFERESSTNAQLKEQISTSELQLNELRINLSIESSLSASLREQMTETVEANVQLNSQLFNAKTDIDALTREINAYKGQIQRLANESASNSELHEQLVQKSLEFDEMQKNTSQMDGVNKQLSAQLKNSLMDIETLQKEIDSYRSQIEALISQQESKNDQKSDSKNDSNMQTDEFFDDNQQVIVFYVKICLKIKHQYNILSKINPTKLQFFPSKDARNAQNRKWSAETNARDKNRRNGRSSCHRGTTNALLSRE